MGGGAAPPHRQPRVAGQPPEESVRVQQEAHRSGTAFPKGQLVLRERFQNAVINEDSPLHGAKAPLALGLAANKPGNRLAPAGDDHLFARLHLGQQTGELGFGFMDIDRGHDGFPRKQLTRNTAKFLDWSSRDVAFERHSHGNSWALDTLAVARCARTRPEKMPA